MRNAPKANIASLSRGGNDSFITCVWDSKPFTIRGDDPLFDQAVAALKSEDWDSLYLYMNPGENFVVSYQKENVSIVNGEVLYRGKPIHNTLTTRIMASLELGIKCDYLFLFMNKLMENPSVDSQNECYDFLENQNIAITPEGNFIAYKGVRSDYYSITSGEAKVLKGQVENGRVFNGIGQVIEVKREDVDADRRNQCSYGLHAGTYKYANDFKGSTGKLLLVEVNPKDVVSVPKDYNCGKLRANAYKVLAECQGPIEKPIYGEQKPQTADADDVQKQVAGAIASTLNGSTASWTRQKRDNRGRFI